MSRYVVICICLCAEDGPEGSGSGAGESRRGSEQRVPAGPGTPGAPQRGVQQGRGSAAGSSQDWRSGTQSHLLYVCCTYAFRGEYHSCSKPFLSFINLNREEFLRNIRACLYNRCIDVLIIEFECYILKQKLVHWQCIQSYKILLFKVCSKFKFRVRADAWCL